MIFKKIVVKISLSTWFGSNWYLYFLANNFDIEKLIAYETIAILIAGCKQAEIKCIGGTVGAGRL